MSVGRIFAIFEPAFVPIKEEMLVSAAWCTYCAWCMALDVWCPRSYTLVARIQEDQPVLNHAFGALAAIILLPCWPYKLQRSVYTRHFVRGFTRRGASYESSGACAFISASTEGNTATYKDDSVRIAKKRFSREWRCVPSEPSRIKLTDGVDSVPLQYTVSPQSFCQMRQSIKIRLSVRPLSSVFLLQRGLFAVFDVNH